MKYLLIINPKAGGGKGRTLIPKIKSVFELNGHYLTVLKTKKVGDGTTLTKKHRAKHDVVIAAGGDGTINEVINGLVGCKRPLGILPLGTENVLSTELKIPSNIGKACTRIIEGRTKMIDLGKANSRYFSLMAGIGFDAHVAAKVRPFWKRVLGGAAYPLTAMREILSYKPAKLTVTIGKKKYEGYFIVVGNSKWYGGKFPLVKNASIDDGMLDVLIFHSPAIYNSFRYVANMLVWKSDLFRDAKYIRTRKLRITAKSPTLVHTDCEIIGTTPAVIEVKKKIISVIC